MSQFVTTVKNPPWVRNAGGGSLYDAPLHLVSAAAGLGQGPTAASAPTLGATILAAQAAQHSVAVSQPLTAGPGPALAAAVAVAQSQQAAQQASSATAAYNTSLAAIGLTQTALQPAAVLSQSGIALPASLTTTNPVGTVSVSNLQATLASAAPVGTVNTGMVVELTRLPQPGLALPTTLATTQVATVSYPAPRLLAQTAQFQPAQTHAHQTAIVQSQPQPQPQQQQQPPPKQRVFTGTVTKLHDNFGFVDEDVFFQISAVKGSMPKVGERVLVEASYNANMPFKWNATRIQVLPNQLNVQPNNNSRVLTTQVGSLANAVPAAVVSAAAASVGLNVNQAITANMASIAGQMPPQFTAVASTGRWPPVNQDMTTLDNLVPTRIQGNVPSSRRHSPPPLPPPPIRRDREREREREVRREEQRRERYREREYERERYSPPLPPRKRSRSPRRTSRSPPRRRARIVPRYTVQVPKISLDLREGNVMELRKRYSNLYIPSDFCCANFLWQEAFPPHHPFTLDHPCSFQIMHKEVDPLTENDAVLEPPDADHSFSAKVMLIATPPPKEIFHKSCALSEDAEDMRENFVHPTRLISFLVGLKGKTETVAIGGPWSPSLDGLNPDKDPQVLIRTAIRTCKALTGIDLNHCSQWFRFAEVYYRRGESSHKGRTSRVETVVLFLPDVWSCLPTRLEWDGLSVSYKSQLQRKLQEDSEDMNETQASTTLEDDEGSQEDQGKKEPTHHSELDPKSMKVADLRKELEARNLSVKGLKSQLIARLTKALRTESEKEEQQGESIDRDEMDDRQESDEEERKKKDEEEKKQKEEKERTTQEKRYQLSENPAVIVHPSRTAKGGRFDCTIMSLSLLLDYRQEDNKEHSFEVSLFAELFNEMLIRDFGFRIYRCLLDIPEQKDDDKDKKKQEKKEEKKERKEERDDYRKKDEVDDSDKDEDESDDDDEEDDNKKEKDKRKKKKKRVQTYTHDPNLLLSFVYFDQTHCGYLLDKDVEDILFTLGLQLSRAQVRKLVQKVIKRETLHYRKMTDRPLNENSETSKVSKYNEGGESKKSLEDIAAGNRRYLPVFRSLESSLEAKTKNLVVENGDQPSKEENSKLPLVRYQGAFVDIGKLLQQLERSEKARTDTEKKLKELEEELEEVHDAAVISERSAERISIELDEHRIKLRSTEDELKKSQAQTDKYYRVLTSSRDQLHTVLSSVDSTLKIKSSRSFIKSLDSATNNNSSSGKRDSIGRKDDEFDLRRIKLEHSNNDS